MSTNDWEPAFDKLLEGMRPKVSNFGSVSDNEATKRMQALFDQWWANADSFYRDPLKSFIRTIEDKAREDERERVRKLVDGMRRHGSHTVSCVNEVTNETGKHDIECTHWNDALSDIIKSLQ